MSPRLEESADFFFFLSMRSGGLAMKSAALAGECSYRLLRRDDLSRKKSVSAKIPLST